MKHKTAVVCTQELMESIDAVVELLGEWSGTKEQFFSLNLCDALFKLKEVWEEGNDLEKP